MVVRTATGRSLVGVLAQELRGEEAQLLGAEFDLAHAYKQWASSPFDVAYSVVARWLRQQRDTPSTSPARWGSGLPLPPLPFNRLARVATAVLVELFLLSATNYFDNFRV